MSSVCRIIGALIVTLLHPSLQAAPMAQAAPLVQATSMVQSSSEPQAVLGSVSLSLPEAVERSRQQHPRVAAALAAEEAAGYRTMQVGKWSNPEVLFYQEQFSGAAPDIDQTIVSVSQRIRIGGQLGLATGAAQQLEEAARSEVGVTQEQLTLLVQRTYAQLYRAQESLAALELARRTIADLLRDLELRVQEGDVAPFDLARMRMEDESLLAQEGRLRVEQRAGWHRLAFLLASQVPESGWVLTKPVAGGGQKGTEQNPTGQVMAVHEGEALDVSRMAIEDRYDVQAAGFRVEAASARAEAAGKEAIPDLVFSLGYTRLDPGINGFVWSVNAAIPLFNSSDASKAAQLAEARRLERQYEALVQEARSEARGAWHEYREVSRTLQDLQRGVEERSEVLPIARTAYEEGEMTVTALLDAARAQLEANLRELELEHLGADAWFRWRYASGQYLGGEGQS